MLIERVHENSKTSDKIESYLLIQPIGFILNKNFLLNSYSSSGQNIVHIQGSAAAHPGVCSNTSRVCNTTSAVCILRNADPGCSVTDSGWAATDPWMGCCSPLDVHHILGETTVALFKKVFVQNKTNRLNQEI